MTIKVIAKENLGYQAKVFYLNTSEPKAQQLYMAIIVDLCINTLTVYNIKTDHFEDVTSLFHPSLIHDLSYQITNQLPPLDKDKAL